MLLAFQIVIGSPPSWSVDLFDLQDLAHRLRDAQVAGRQQTHEAIARLFIDDHLAEGADLVEARVGARVGQKNHSGVELDGDAISHCCRAYQAAVAGIHRTAVGRRSNQRAALEPGEPGPFSSAFELVKLVQRFARAQGVGVDALQRGLQGMARARRSAAVAQTGRPGGGSVRSGFPAPTVRAAHAAPPRRAHRPV
jgi:hypothetical protein